METPRTTFDPAELTAHSQWMRALALRLVRDSAQADDLVQETLLVALERRPSPGTSLKPWLRRVLSNRFAFRSRGDAHRRQREEQNAPEEALPSSRELLEVAEAHSSLIQALTRLRDPYRTALLLRYYEGLEPREIARRLGIPAATVRSHLKRGIDELRKDLDERSAGDRSAWSIALVPFAADAAHRAGISGTLSALINTLRAMNPFSSLLIPSLAGSSLVVLLAVFAVDRLQPEEPTLAGVGATDPTRRLPELSVAVENHPADTQRNAIAGSTTMLATSDGLVHGTLHDAKSGAPLAEYALRFGAPGTDQEVVWTDASGNFTSEREYPAGEEVGITFVDHPETATRVTTARQAGFSTNSVYTQRTWDPEQGPLQLKAAVGRTYELAITAPFEWAGAGLVGSLQAAPGGPEGTPAVVHELRTPLREGEEPWVRFGLALTLPENRPWVLRLESPDGLWAGETQVEAGGGSSHAPVALTLVSTASLEVAILSPVKLRDLTIHAEDANTGYRWLLWNMGGTELEDGRRRYVMERKPLSAGAYHIFVTRDGDEQLRASVTLEAGQAHTEEIELALGATTSFVRGELKSTSGQYRDSVTLYLQAVGSSTEAFQSLEWEERDGEWVAPFSFDNLPPGDYGVVISELLSFHRWDDLHERVSTPREDWILTCRDTEPVHTVQIDVKDHESGESIPACFAWITPEDCAISQSSGSSGGRQYFGNVPVDVHFKWWVDAEGYIPRWGDESTMAPDGEDGLIEVALEHGWGARIDARKQGSSEPLAGVQVSIDGEAVGVTDAEGHIELITEEVPGRIDLTLEGWHFVSGNYDQATGQFTGIVPTRKLIFAEEQPD